MGKKSMRVSYVVLQLYWDVVLMCWVRGSRAASAHQGSAASCSYPPLTGPWSPACSAYSYPEGLYQRTPPRMNTHTVRIQRLKRCLLHSHMYSNAPVNANCNWRVILLKRKIFLHNLTPHLREMLIFPIAWSSFFASLCLSEVYNGYVLAS